MLRQSPSRAGPDSNHKQSFPSVRSVTREAGSGERSFKRAKSYAGTHPSRGGQREGDSYGGDSRRRQAYRNTESSPLPPSTRVDAMGGRSRGVSRITGGGSHQAGRALPRGARSSAARVSG